ncbi:MAG TPA: SUMF1/EgtB/PvdO family nonheme iron enzyme, partial [Candidatus Wallbacteria bacterium]|nr:SUMF1/EgtB/PvdO family nonheme iron enzyme [Candidatus Wallbacteria bacterium]
TEAQYEKAGRGAYLSGLKNSFEEKRYPWGNFFASGSLNCASSGSADERKISGAGGTTPVYKYGPQGYYGLYDIAGNLNSWCRDWYGASYPAARINPYNAVVQQLKAVRGGSWKSESFECMTSSRHGANPMFYTHDDIGIRPCVSPAK